MDLRPLAAALWTRGKPYFTAGVRSALLGGGVWLVDHHILSDAQLNQAVSFLMVTGAVVWSQLQKAKAADALDDAIAAPAGLAKPPGPGVGVVAGRFLRNLVRPQSFEGTTMFDFKGEATRLAGLFEGYVRHVPPELQADAGQAITDLKALAVKGLDTETTAVAPQLAPELEPLYPEFIDWALDKTQARLTALTTAKAALVPAGGQ